MYKINVVMRYEDNTEHSVFVYGHSRHEALVWAKEKFKSNVEIKDIRFQIVKRTHGKKWVSENYYKEFRQVKMNQSRKSGLR